MKDSKKKKIGMFRNSLSKSMEESFHNSSHRNKAEEVLDRLEGVSLSELAPEAKQLLRDIKSIQSHNEALLEKAVQFLNQFEKKSS